MKLNLEDFKPLTMDDREIFSDHYSKFPVNHSENVFTTLISWQRHHLRRVLFRQNWLLVDKDRRWSQVV